MDLKQRATVAAMQYRDFWNENPKLAIGIGFVPVVGSLVGIVDAAAANMDDRADALEKGLATAGILPYGKALGAIKTVLKGGAGPISAIMGPYAIKQAQRHGREGELINRRFDTEFGVETAEMLQPTKITPEQIHRANKTPQGEYRKWQEIAPEDPYGQIVPEVGETDFLLTPRASVGSGSMEMKKGGKGMLGTGMPGYTPNAPISRADLDDVTKAALHERTHKLQQEEYRRGFFPKHGRGADPEVKGMWGYHGNLGELDAESAAMRRDWDIDELELVNPEEHRNAMRMKMQENIEKGRALTYEIGILQRPEVARRYADKAVTDLNPGLKTSATRGAVKWNRPQVDADADEWFDADMLEADNLLDLDPKLGEKVRKGMIQDESWSARYSGDKTNYAKKMMFDEGVDVPTVHVKWDPVKEEWAAVEVDGARRAIAARNMFGRDTLVPVKYRPVDEASRLAAQDPANRAARVRTDYKAWTEDANTYGLDRSSATGKQAKITY